MQLFCRTVYVEFLPQFFFLGGDSGRAVVRIADSRTLTDMEVGYKVFRRHILDRIDLKSNRFGFEPEVTAKIARLRPRIYEVPISYSGRSYEEGKKITWKDGVEALFCIAWFRFFK